MTLTLVTKLRLSSTLGLEGNTSLSSLSRFNLVDETPWTLLDGAKAEAAPRRKAQTTVALISIVDVSSCLVKLDRGFYVLCVKSNILMEIYESIF